MPTIIELGQKVKIKYPEYKDLSDLELGQKVKAKYPEAYMDFEDVEEKKKDEGIKGFLKSRLKNLSMEKEGLEPVKGPTTKQEAVSRLDVEKIAGLALGFGPGSLAGGLQTGTKQGVSKLSGLAKKLYQSALKPTKAVLDDFPNVVETGLKEGITVSKGGLEKVNTIIDDINSEITEKISTAAKKGTKISSKNVAGRIEQAKSFFENTLTPKKYLNQLDELIKEFRGYHGQKIPIDVAQKLKQNTYTLLRKAYGELGAASTEGQKALARGLKEEIASAIPEISSLNKRESELIGLNNALERFVGREANKELVGLREAGVAAVGAMAKGPLGLLSGLATKLFDDPAIKSSLAKVIYKVGKTSSNPTLKALSKLPKNQLLIKLEGLLLQSRNQ